MSQVNALCGCRVLPNPSFKPTRYGRQRKGGPRYLDILANQPYGGRTDAKTEEAMYYATPR